MEEKKNVLIGCTGSVATVRLDSIVQAFKSEFNIKIILTNNSKVFAEKIIPDFSAYELLHGLKFYIDEDEYKEYRENDSVLHIETCVIRAWDFSKRGFFALAMNTYMYEHFLTAKQIKILLEDFKFIEIPPVVKKLKCGDFGIGGIADTALIYDIVLKELNKK